MGVHEIFVSASKASPAQIASPAKMLRACSFTHVRPSRRCQRGPSQPVLDSQRQSPYPAYSAVWSCQHSKDTATTGGRSPAVAPGPATCAPVLAFGGVPGGTSWVTTLPVRIRGRGAGRGRVWAHGGDV